MNARYRRHSLSGCWRGHQLGPEGPLSSGPLLKVWEFDSSVPARGGSLERGNACHAATAASAYEHRCFTLRNCGLGLGRLFLCVGYHRRWSQPTKVDLIAIYCAGRENYPPRSPLP